MDRPYSEARDAKYPPRYTPSSLDDDWAIGVETLGLDDATIQGLISQVNREAYHWASAAPGEFGRISHECDRSWLILQISPQHRKD
jgi:hypothetical protein